MPEPHKGEKHFDYWQTREGMTLSPNACKRCGGWLSSAPYGYSLEDAHEYCHGHEFEDKVNRHLEGAEQLVEAVIYEHESDMSEDSPSVARAVVDAIRERLLLSEANWHSGVVS